MSATWNSSLNSFLFFLYINNIPDNSQSQIRLFADETVAYLTYCTPKHSPTPSNTWKRTWDMVFRLIRVVGDWYPFRIVLDWAYRG